MSTATTIPSGTWAADTAHSTLGFSVKHLGIATVRGSFGEFEGKARAGRRPLDREDLRLGKGRIDRHRRAPA
ncbi:MAG: YceI family protein [Solirubrobacteraceae bacterium]